MAVDVANFIAQNQPRFNRAAIDREHYGNALMRNEVDRIPQRNRAEDLQIQAQDAQITEAGKRNAAGVVGRNLAMAAASRQPSQAYRALISNPDFLSAGKVAGVPVDQFTYDPATDTDDALRQQMQAWADALSGTRQNQRVQSTQVLEDGTIAYVTSDGQLVRTNERARNPMQVADVGGAPALVDRLSGGVRPLSTPEAENRAAADRAAATTTATTTAQATAERQNAQTANERTLGVWQVAREGLVKALQGTETGPLAGRVPAVTAGQQIAEGAVAAVAPVLKQLFRSAGEGVFTDRDQQLLLDMVPTRTDHPEAATAKIQMIDSIIDAKLRAGGGAAGGPKTFATEAEADAAARAGTIKPGDRITIGGQSGVWQ